MGYQSQVRIIIKLPDSDAVMTSRDIWFCGQLVIMDENSVSSTPQFYGCHDYISPFTIICVTLLL
jgi:hypothetical protein